MVDIVERILLFGVFVFVSSLKVNTTAISKVLQGSLCKLQQT